MIMGIVSNRKTVLLIAYILIGYPKGIGLTRINGGSSTVESLFFL